MTTTAPATTLPGPARVPSTTTLLRAEVADELKAIVREPTALVFSILMPVGFFAVFAGFFGGQTSAAGAAASLPTGTTMLASFGAFGVLAVSAMSPGIGLAEDRQRGWLRVKRTWAVPLPVTLAAKVVASLPYSLGTLTAMTAVSAAYGHLVLGPSAWATLVASLLLGSLPFALVGLAVGAVASPNAAAAVLNAVLMPSAIVGGLWFPLEILPPFVGRLAPWVPTYHLGELGKAAIGGGQRLDHVLALLAATAVAAVLAGLTYRRTRP